MRKLIAMLILVGVSGAALAGGWTCTRCGSGMSTLEYPGSVPEEVDGCGGCTNSIYQGTLVDYWANGGIMRLFTNSSITVHTNFTDDYSTPAYYTNTMAEYNITSNVVQALVDSGEVCRVVGHVSEVFIGQHGPGFRERALITETFRECLYCRKTWVRKEEWVSE